jgi:hypothetical protein
MRKSGILYDSLPMMRLGARDDTEEVVIAPDFSISAYMLEEYITLAAAKIAIPSSAPESKRLADLPALLRKRVRVIDDAAEREAISRLLHPVRVELGVKELKDGKQLRFPKTMPRDAQHTVRLIHKTLFQLAIGFNHGLQVSISPSTVQLAIRTIRKDLHDNDGRAILAQVEGLLAVYEDVTFESPRPPAAGPPELVSLFDRLLNDPNYLELSEAVSEIGTPQKRSAALSRVREWGRKLVTNVVFAKGWNYTGKVVKAWTGAPVPEADTLLTIISGKQFPLLVDLRDARKRAVRSWQGALNTRPPLSASGDEYDGVSWILPGTPPENWDGGDISTYTLGTVGELKAVLENFAQQSTEGDGLKPAP